MDLPRRESTRRMTVILDSMWHGSDRPAQTSIRCIRFITSVLYGMVRLVAW